MSGIEPKYIQVQRRLQQRIESGELRPGERLPSEASLCRELNVSRITVRRALAELARRGYLKSRGGYGHVVHTAQPTTTIGVLMNQPMFGHMQKHQAISHFAMLLMNALRWKLRQRGYHCRLYLPQPYEAEPQLDHGALYDDLQRGTLAGLITSGWPHEAHKHSSQVHLADVRLQQAVERQGVPLVSVTGRDVCQASISTDYFALGHLGAEYFLQANVRSIALLTLNRPDNPTCDGFAQALADWGQRPRESWIFSVDQHNERCGYEAFVRWWSSLEQRPEALVIDDDHTGKGAMLAATRMGLDTDSQLRIACQSLLGSEMFWPRPCVKLQLDPMAYAQDAVAKIAQMLAEPPIEPERTWIRPTIVEDQSDVAARIDIAEPATRTSRRVTGRQAATTQTEPARDKRSSSS